VTLDADRHRATGATLHTVGGKTRDDAHALRIVRYGVEAGFYFLYLDEMGREVTDTWHKSLDDAMHQADFEFSVKPNDWTTLASE
jgi:hypothetical protein